MCFTYLSNIFWVERIEPLLLSSVWVLGGRRNEPLLLNIPGNRKSFNLYITHLCMKKGLHIIANFFGCSKNKDVLLDKKKIRDLLLKLIIKND
jgi:hypothetical protein